MAQIFQDGRWVKAKMIRSFARLGKVEMKFSVNYHDEVCSHCLLLTFQG